MNTLLWILQVALALVFAMTGVAGFVAKQDPRKAEMDARVVTVFGPTTVKLIGALNVAIAIALILPPVVAFIPAVAVPAGASILAVQMAVMYTLSRRAKGALNRGFTGVMFLIASFVALGRFVLSPLGG